MEQAKEQLIKGLITEGVLKTPEIIEAFRKIDRRDFVRPTQKGDAYIDTPLLIGGGQTISQPWTVAFMLEQLRARAGEKVLDIGYGSGWSAALLAELVGDKGKVIALEIVPELSEFGRENIEKYGLIKSGRVETYNQSGIGGFPAGAPFDRIIAAAAGGRIPRAWGEQLKTGGRIVAPVGSRIAVLDKLAGNKWESREHAGFRFVPLVDA